jgi:hypothetical protein
MFCQILNAGPTVYYQSLLDICDQIWAESKLIEWAQRREKDLKNSSYLLYICQFVIQRLTLELKSVEAKCSDLKLTLCHLCDRCFSDYPAHHLTHMIQPFLLTHCSAVPDYSLFDYKFDMFSNNST